MTKANGQCTKCGGTGFVSAPVHHLGVPGLCFQCDGAGTYEAAAAKRAETRARRAADAAYRAVSAPVLEKIFARKRAADSRRLTGFAVRQAASAMKAPFTTDEFAAVLGCDRQTAFDTLCDLYPMRVEFEVDVKAGRCVGWVHTR